MRLRCATALRSVLGLGERRAHELKRTLARADRRSSPSAPQSQNKQRRCNFRSRELCLRCMQIRETRSSTAAAAIKLLYRRILRGVRAHRQLQRSLSMKSCAATSSRVRASLQLRVRSSSWLQLCARQFQICSAAANCEGCARIETRLLQTRQFVGNLRGGINFALEFASRILRFLLRSSNASLVVTIGALSVAQFRVAEGFANPF